MRVTLKDIAKRANISTATVSRAINNKHAGNMRLETYEKIKNIIKETNYTPHAVASGLRTGLTKVIGIVVPDNVNPYYAQLGHAIEDECFKAGYTAFICNTNQDLERERKYARLLSSHRVSGIILCSTGLLAEEIISEIHHSIKVVLVDEEVEGFGGVIIIGNDFRGGYIGLEYLYSLGHENILIITGPMNLSSNKDRFNGLLQCAAEHERVIDPHLVVNANFTVESAYSAVKSIVNRESFNFTAIFTFNDLMAIGSLKALNESEIKVPRDISLLGYDNIFLDEIIKPALSTVATPIKQLGVCSFQRIIESIMNKEERVKPEKVLLEPKLMERESCRKIQSSLR